MKYHNETSNKHKISLLNIWCALRGILWCYKHFLWIAQNAHFFVLLLLPCTFSFSCLNKENCSLNFEAERIGEHTLSLFCLKTLASAMEISVIYRERDRVKRVQTDKYIYKGLWLLARPAFPQFINSPQETLGRYECSNNSDFTSYCSKRS